MITIWIANLMCLLSKVWRITQWAVNCIRRSMIGRWTGVCAPDGGFAKCTGALFIFNGREFQCSDCLQQNQMTSPENRRSKFLSKWHKVQRMTLQQKIVVRGVHPRKKDQQARVSHLTTAIGPGREPSHDLLPQAFEDETCYFREKFPSH
ncbi:hypothetical protein Acr_05g0013770 [Actinidia rufa]|uniref:Uncharacterized protein n=1 Tax=Actinidia rufa TaxID=165716 RepID=A0A7J0EMN5_9ERIC|nr:hypothetical protein Acr_05g0013770 [Actinidia rufa]